MYSRSEVVGGNRNRFFIFLDDTLVGVSALLYFTGVRYFYSKASALFSVLIRHFIALLLSDTCDFYA